MQVTRNEASKQQAYARINLRYNALNMVIAVEDNLAYKRQEKAYMALVFIM